MSEGEKIEEDEEFYPGGIFFGVFILGMQLGEMYYAFKDWVLRRLRKGVGAEE